MKIVYSSKMSVECQRWGKKERGQAEGGRSITLSLKRVDTHKHDYLGKTDPALTVVTG